MITTRLTMRDTGQWWMKAESGSLYRLDLDTGAVVRVLDPEHYGDIESLDMRHDGDPLQLIGLLLEVGHEGHLAQVGLRDRAAMLRTTSRVVAIWPDE